MKWPESEIETPEGLQKAIAPGVISASRSTDIPAFYSEWFMNRLRQGYVKWLNPFNQLPQYVSFENAKVIVFWSKNPLPLLPFLPEIDDLNLAYYFHFTLNDYEDEGLEPGVPPLTERIDTFQNLSKMIGSDRVVWRFDPLILTRNLSIERLLEKVKRVGDQIAPFTKKLVFSFADIGVYRKVRNNLNRAGIEYDEFDKDRMVTAAKGIGKLCREWGIAASTCAEPSDLSECGVEHNRCIDDDLILKITGNSPEICRLFGVDVTVQDDMFTPSVKPKKKIKDTGQRAECGCVFSKDIGQYNTCPHLCVYCYANTSEKVVARNAAAASETAESILADPLAGKKS